MSTGETTSVAAPALPATAIKAAQSMLLFIGLQFVCNGPWWTNSYLGGALSTKRYLTVQRESWNSNPFFVGLDGNLQVDW